LFGVAELIEIGGQVIMAIKLFGGLYLVWISLSVCLECA
jgi:threonine/homoserine/homoserine lactone efflux protein